MALNLENEGALIALIQNKDKNIKDKRLYASSDADNVKNGGPVYTCEKDETLQVVPNTKTERTCLYIAGQAGSGKSFYTGAYVHRYKILYPKNDIYLFSSIDEDKSIDSLKPKRINVLHPDFIREELSSVDFKNALVIFDDIDVFPTPIRKKVMSIVNNILIIGRHSNTSIIYTVHSPTAGVETKLLLIEATIIVIFPKTTGNRALKYLLDSYLGLDKKQIERVKKMKSRAVSIIRGYPQVIVGEKQAFLAHEF